MLFHSPEFILLSAITLLLFWRLPRTRTPILAVANILFYAASGWPYLLLFLAIASLTYWFSVLIHRGVRPKLLLWIGVGGSLLNLAIFKYTAFAVTNLERLLHLGLDPKLFQLLLPVGISFYTFQLVAYLVDVYRGDLKPARSLIEFWVFIAFFAQLIAGPIMRGKDFLPQIAEHDGHRFQFERFKYGIFLFLIGLSKKVILSDTIGPLADKFFNQGAAVGGLEAWIGAYLFAFQIYFDFSAYSDMAVGIGHMFGYQLTDNFKTPYLSGNPAEFWRRWHITLSRWIRDYVYIPLGGSRHGEFRAMAAIVVAMTLSGFWHGAAWTFIAWGIFHGLLSAFHRLWTRQVAERVKLPVPAWVTRWLSIFLMFQATTIGWVFFRANGMTVALTMVKRMLTLSDLHLTRTNLTYLVLVAALFLLHLAEFWFRTRQRALYETWRRWLPGPVRALAYTLAVVLAVVMASTKQMTFIYFRF